MKKKSFIIGVMFIWLISFFIMQNQKSITITNKKFTKANDETKIETINTQMTKSIIQDEEVKIDDTDKINGKIKITLNNKNYINKDVKFAVWSAENNQDDIKWYNADKELSYIVELKNHKSVGDYNVHVYYFDNNGPHLIAKKVFKIASPTIENVTTTFDENTNNLHIKVTNITSESEVTKVYFPTWSNNNGQDDLKWYEAKFNKADNSYELTINISNHGFDKGFYSIHIYVETKSGIFTLVKSIQKEVNPKNILIANTNSSNTGFNISYANYKAYQNNILYFAVWSNNNGQDDLKWYIAKNGIYNGVFADHLNKNYVADTGIYHVHVYVNKNGKMILLEKGTFTVNRTPLTNTIEITPQQKGTFTVNIKNVFSTIKNISVYVWSNKNGADDRKEYIATKQNDGYKATINLNNHKYDSGTYSVHVYIHGIDKSIGLPLTTKVTINPGNVNIENINNEDKNIKVTLSNSDYINSNIKFAVWSDNNGQNDLKWYDAKKINNNDLNYIIPISNHKDSGVYHVHTYSVVNGTPIHLYSHTFNIAANDGTAEIINLDEDDADGNGIYQVKVNNAFAKSGVKEVKIAIWSDNNGQDDVKWYTAKKTRNDDGSYSYITDNILPREHKYDSGKYITHAYIYANNGVEKLIVLPQKNINLLPISKSVTNLGKGQLRVNLINISSKTSEVLLPTWTETNGQDDIKWYRGKRQSDYSWNVIVKSVKHFPKGKTIAHIYTREPKQNSIVLRNKIEFNTYAYGYVPFYFYQKDPIWVNKQYGPYRHGATGCMPTSLAMSYTEILSRMIIPSEVGEYLYNYTNTFNKLYIGAGALSVKYASEHYEVDWEPLGSVGKIKTALGNGAIVIGAVGQGYFIGGLNATHAIVIYGGGGTDPNTIVYDANNPGKNGVYNIDSLYNQQSHVPEDTYYDNDECRNGCHFYALY